MNGKKGKMSASKVIILVVIIVILLGATVFIWNNLAKEKSGSDVQDLTSDYLDEAFTELDNVDFSIGS